MPHDPTEGAAHAPGDARQLIETASSFARREMLPEARQSLRSARAALAQRSDVGPAHWCNACLVALEIAARGGDAREMEAEAAELRSLSGGPYWAEQARARIACSNGRVDPSRLDRVYAVLAGEVVPDACPSPAPRTHPEAMARGIISPTPCRSPLDEPPLDPSHAKTPAPIPAAEPHSALSRPETPPPAAGPRPPHSTRVHASEPQILADHPEHATPIHADDPPSVPDAFPAPAPPRAADTLPPPAHGPTPAPSTASPCVEPRTARPEAPASEQPASAPASRGPLLDSTPPPQRQASGVRGQEATPLLRRPANAPGRAGGVTVATGHASPTPSVTRLLSDAERRAEEGGPVRAWRVREQAVDLATPVCVRAVLLARHAAGDAPTPLLAVELEPASLPVPDSPTAPPRADLAAPRGVAPAPRFAPERRDAAPPALPPPGPRPRARLLRAALVAALAGGAAWMHLPPGVRALLPISRVRLDDPVEEAEQALASGDAPRALEIAGTLSASGDGGPRVLLVRGLALLATGDTAAAAAALAAAAQGDSRGAVAWSAAGSLSRVPGHAAAAADAYLLAFAAGLPAGHAETVARAQERAGHPDRARRVREQSAAR